MRFWIDYFKTKRFWKRGMAPYLSKRETDNPLDDAENKKLIKDFSDAIISIKNLYAKRNYNEASGLVQELNEQFRSTFAEDFEIEKLTRMKHLLCDLREDILVKDKKAKENKNIFRKNISFRANYNSIIQLWQEDFKPYMDNTEIEAFIDKMATLKKAYKRGHLDIADGLAQNLGEEFYTTNPSMLEEVEGEFVKVNNPTYNHHFDNEKRREMISLFISLREKIYNKMY